MLENWHWSDNIKVYRGMYQFQGINRIHIIEVAIKVIKKPFNGLRNTDLLKEVSENNPYLVKYYATFED